MANTSFSIIGADFISHYGLLVDLKNENLIDVETKLAQRCHMEVIGCDDDIQIVGFVPPDGCFEKLLGEYEDITVLTNFKKPKTHIETSGAPVNSKFRRLSPEKQKMAYNEFQQMLKNVEKLFSCFCSERYH